MDFLDDAAFRDLGPLPAGLARLVRAVASDVHTDRRPVAGWAAPAGRPIRVSCARPGHVVAGILRLPAAEIVRSVEVRVKADEIEMAGESSGTPAVRIVATCTPLGSPILRPAVDPADWTEYDTGDTVDVTLTARVDSSGSRWVVVTLWVWSLARDTETCSGTMDSYWALGGIEYTVGSGSLPGTVLPEHSIVFYSDPASKPLDIAAAPIGFAWQVEYIDSGNGRFYISPATLSLLNTGGDTEWAMYALGVLPIQSVECRVVAQDPVPIPAASEFRVRKPVDDDPLSIVDYTTAKQAGYGQYAWAHAGIGLFSGDRQLWPTVSGVLFPNSLTRRTLRTGVVTDAEAGLICVAMLAGLAVSPAAFDGSLGVQARLAAYAIGDDPDTDTAIEVGDWVSLRIPLPGEGAWLGGESYSRLAQTLWGAAYFDHWQSRGVISGGDGASPDWAMVPPVVVTLGPVEVPAYRAALQLRVRDNAPGSNTELRTQITEIALIASSCVALDLDESA